MVEVTVDYAGRPLTLQTGKLAKQADGAVLCRYGETVVLATVVSSKELRSGQDFFPLTVDFQEKYYASGRLPGGFFKREARPSEQATLWARMIDRPIRPLFPEDYMYDTQVVITVLAYDGVNEANLIGQIAASAALHISDIPWNGPVACCRVGHLDGELVLNFKPDRQEDSLIDLTVSAVRDGVVMVEGGAKEVSEQEMMDAIDFAYSKMKPILDLQDEFREKAGKAKREYQKVEKDALLYKELKGFLKESFGAAFSITEKLKRYEALSNLKKDAILKFGSHDLTGEEDPDRNKRVETYYEELKAEFARSITLDSKKRIDGRSYTDIRPITCEVGVIPRVHGTGLFTRGETQVLSVVTLGTSEDEQKIDSIYGVYQKTFMLHYNFPAFSVGEAKPMRSPGRREIGHGTLAERAVMRILPTSVEFPYTIRIVSEVLESNGSSSMASVCSSSLALMDAGVPVKKPVAGVAMGLIKEGSKIAILSDILGDEDHLGDMDFKVCGTEDGITAFQMDLKIGGITREIMEQALSQAREGRLHILGKMADSISAPRESLSELAPRIHTLKIKQDKIREVIGPGGKMIKSIIERTGVKMNIEDDGTVRIASSDNQAAQEAIRLVEGICEEPEAGKIYEGKVTRIVDFGAFVEIIPNTEGLLHISELDHRRVGSVDEILHEGDIVRVKCLEVDSNGKIRLSRKALIEKEGGGRDSENHRRRESRETTVDAETPEGSTEQGLSDEGADTDLEAPPLEEGSESPEFDRGSARPERGPREPRGGQRDRHRDHRGNRGDRNRQARGNWDRGRDRDRDRDRDRGGDRDRGPERGPDRGGPDRNRDRERPYERPTNNYDVEDSRMLLQDDDDREIRTRETYDDNRGNRRDEFRERSGGNRNRGGGREDFRGGRGGRGGGRSGGGRSGGGRGERTPSRRGYYED